MISSHAILANVNKVVVVLTVTVVITVFRLKTVFGRNTISSSKTSIQKKVIFFLYFPLIF